MATGTLRYVGKCLACHSLLKNIELDPHWFFRCPVCGWTFQASDVPPAKLMDFIKAIYRKLFGKGEK